MQHLTVDASFFWIMLFVAFAVGILLQRWTARDERRAARKLLHDAADLMGEIATFARVRNHGLPMAMHRRLCDFRARVGA